MKNQKVKVSFTDIRGGSDEAVIENGIIDFGWGKLKLSGLKELAGIDEPGRFVTAVDEITFGHAKLSAVLLNENIQIDSVVADPEDFHFARELSRCLTEMKV